MKILNEKQIAITHRNIEDFVENYKLDSLITLSLYSPSIGMVVDWSCNEDTSFKVSIQHLSFVVNKYFLIKNHIHLNIVKRFRNCFI